MNDLRQDAINVLLSNQLVGELLPAGEQADWYRSVHGQLADYHQWLYRERAGHGSGLVVLIHPWETGLDTTPPWLESLRGDPPPWWLRIITGAKPDRAAGHLRWDTRYVPADQRSSVVEALRFYDALRHLRKHRYDAAAILNRPHFAIEDLAYNSILIRANVLPRQISQVIGARLPGQLTDSMRKNEEAMETLWDEADGCYYYWQGPTWVNTNWLLIDGLRRSASRAKPAACGSGRWTWCGRTVSLSIFIRSPASQRG